MRFRRAAAGQQYAIIVGLVGVVAIAAITSVGGGVKALMTGVSNRLGNVSAESGGPALVPAAPGTVFDFFHTGGPQSLTVPSSGTYTLEAWGAQGGTPRHLHNSVVAPGGAGGYAKGNIVLTAGDVLGIHVGGQGSEFTDANRIANQGAAGGYNGGGRSGCPNSTCNQWGTSGHASIPAGGGGASDIRRGGNGYAERIIVAGGGGSSSREGNDHDANGDRLGGSGGGASGTNGSGPGTFGTAGTANNPGANGATAAGFGYGGDGHNNDAGGGGGGWYGGGGGGNNGGGGGGSGYTGSLAAASMLTGVRSGHGAVRITFVGP